MFVLVSLNYQHKFSLKLSVRYIALFVYLRRPISLKITVDFFVLFLLSRGGNVFGSVDYLNAMDTRQYLYCLSPRPELYEENTVLKVLVFFV